MKNKNVIYTAIFGGKDVLHEPRFIPEGFDFICFTDDHTINSKTWDVRYVEAPFPDPVRSARYYKVMVHKFLGEYEKSVWIDGNMMVIGEVNEFLQKYKGVSLAVYNHAYLKRRVFGMFWIRDYGFARDCIYDEAKNLIEKTESGRYMDDPVLIEAQITRYRAEGYPAHNGLAATMVLLRDHTDMKMRQVMETWWDEITKGSRRDQLSFNYAIWKHSFPFIAISGDPRHNPYFGKMKHAKKQNPVF